MISLKEPTAILSYQWAQPIFTTKRPNEHNSKIASFSISLSNNGQVRKVICGIAEVVFDAALFWVLGGKHFPQQKILSAKLFTQHFASTLFAD